MITDSFPALKERNFRLYFIAQLISLAGTYLQSTAQGWLVFELTKSAFWVGLVAALVYFPTFLLVLFGGAIVDRLDRRNILYGTQTVAMILALILGVLTIAGHINILEVTVLALCLGIVNALDTPARTAFIPDMITDREHLASATSLNSGISTAAQAVGPALAGILLVYFGTGYTFIINALTFLAVLAALFGMRFELKRVEDRIREHPMTMVKSGMKYFFSNRSLVFLAIISGCMAVFGRSFNSILPVVAVQVYHGGSEVLGLFLSCFGAGAAIGAFFLAAALKRISTKPLMIAGNFIVALSLIAFAFSHNLPLGLLIVFAAGFGFVIELSTVITIFQHEVPGDIRGRTISILFFIYFGGISLGSFLIGLAADRIGILPAIGVSGGAALIVGFVLLAYKDRILELK